MTATQTPTPRDVMARIVQKRTTNYSELVPGSYALREADDYLAALHAAGFAVVPVEPTPLMKKRGNFALVGWVAPAMHSDDAYRAMLAAAQEGRSDAR